MLSGKIALEMCKYLTVFDASGNKVYENSGGAARRLAEQVEKFDGVINDAYEKSGGVARNLADKTAVLDGSLNEAVRTIRRAFPQSVGADAGQSIRLGY